MTTPPIRVLRPATIVVRHVVVSTPNASGATSAGGTWFMPQDVRGINGEGGWISAELGDHVGEKAPFKIKLPNAAGGDGVLHRDRFLLLSGKAQPLAVTGQPYRPGDEWLEFYEATGGAPLGRPLFVGTPTKWTLTRDSLELTGWDAGFMLDKERETAAGWVLGGPRDVFEDYTTAWRPALLEDFEYGPGSPARFSGTTDALGRWQITKSDGGTAPVPSTATDNRPSSVRLTANGVVTDSSSVTMRSQDSVPYGAKSYGAPAVNGRQVHGGVRLEAQMRPGGTAWGAAGGFALALNVAGDPLSLAYIKTDSTGAITCSAVWDDAMTNLPSVSEFKVTNRQFKADVSYSFAIEWRHRWIFFYIDETLLGVLPAPRNAVTRQAQALVQVSRAGNADNSGVPGQVWLDVESVTFRYRAPMYLRGATKGDLRLPVAPAATAGTGLIAHYFDDHEVRARDGGVGMDTAHNDYPHLLMPPQAEPYAKVLDRVINGPGAAMADFPQPGPYLKENFSVRWMGSVYLDLDAYDYHFRTTADDRMKVWIGRTRWDLPYLSDWPDVGTGHPSQTTTGVWLKGGNAGTAAPAGSAGQLAGMKSGWYPIIVEFSNGSNGGNPTGYQALLEVARSDARTTYYVANDPATQGGVIVRFAPEGIYQNYVRYDSHSAQLTALRDTFGVQWTVEPRTLESGEFPGQIIPRVRVGRDTAYVLDSIEGQDLQSSGDAEDVVDRYLLDTNADSIPDATGKQSGVRTVTREALRQPAQGEVHLSWPADYSSLTDVSQQDLAAQRARSLLTLKSMPWEEVGVKPTGNSELVDSLPLSGAAARFDWQAGDGVRLDLPELGVQDASARQMISVTWPIVPRGIGRPSVGFRQRPRGFKELLRDLVRGNTGQLRNAQTKTQTLTGTYGIAGGFANVSDGYSRVPVPFAPDEILSCKLVVTSTAATAPYVVNVNGVATSLSIFASGVYDLTPYARNFSTTGGSAMYVLLTGGTGNIEFQLVIEGRLPT